MSSPRTLGEVAQLPDEMTLRRLLALLGTPQTGGAREAA